MTEREEGVVYNYSAVGNNQHDQRSKVQITALEHITVALLRACDAPLYQNTALYSSPPLDNTAMAQPSFIGPLC